MQDAVKSEASAKTTRNPKHKVFLLALDATSLSYLQDNCDALPNLQKLLLEGKVVETETSANLLSASSWQTFAAGALPGEHGHYFPLQWDPERMRFRPIKGNMLYFEPFWNQVARGGIETVVFDVMSVPLSKVAQGIQVINWNTQCNFQPITNRPEILDYIRRNFGRKPIGDEVACRKSRRVLTRLRDRLITSLRKKTDAMLWLLETCNWRLFITAYYEGHRAGHNLWPLWEDFASDPPKGAMLDVYHELDAQLGRLFAKLNRSETSVVLFSMHGMTAGYAQAHFLPAAIDLLNARYMDGKGEHASQHHNITRILRDTVPASIQLRAREMLGQTIQDWLIDREWRAGMDWRRTPAFPVPTGGDTGFIRLNLEGREKYGCLPANGAGRDDFVAFLCQNLRAIRVMQTNTPLVRDIVFAEEKFPGPRSYLLPDLLVVWERQAPANEVWSPELGTIRAHMGTGRGGNHTGESFAVLNGPVADGGRAPPLRHIADYSSFVTGVFAQ